jgi:hypothetical protein
MSVAWKGLILKLHIVLYFVKNGRIWDYASFMYQWHIQSFTYQFECITSHATLVGPSAGILVTF